MTTRYLALASATLLLGAVAVAQPLAMVRPLADSIPLVADGKPVAGLVYGGDSLAAATELQAALKAVTGVELPLVRDDVDLATADRNLILLGNMTSNRALEQLYLWSYTYEDLAYPGAGAGVVRPLIDPLGTGHHVVVVGASDGEGLAQAVAYLKVSVVNGCLPARLHVAGLSPAYRAQRNFAEVGPASAYVKTGDPKYAQAYRDYVLKEWSAPDDVFLNGAHLLYWKKALSWELMESSGVFSDAERLRLANQLLKIVRSPEGCQYVKDMSSGPGVRGNHATRAAMGFFYATRYFANHYAGQIPAAEIATWRRTLDGFWSLQLQAYRNFDEALSQHAFGGSLDNTLNFALARPDLGAPFLKQHGRRMAEYLLTLCNNLGWVPVSGDSSFSDYPVTVLQKLAYAYRDGRYLYPVSRYEARGVSSDECLRDFAVGTEPTVPVDQVGIRPVAPCEPLLYIWPEASSPGRPALDRTFDKLSFRQGWEPADQYLLLDGLGYFSHAYADMNTVQEFSADGRVWLCQPDAFRGPTLQFHNGLTYVRDGLGPLAPQGWAELQRTASGKRHGYTRTALPAYGDADWVRHILWTRGQSFFVLDQLVAQQGGDFKATVRWRSLGEADLREGRLDALQDDHEPGELLPPDLLKIVTPGIECINATYTCNYLLVKSARVGDGVEFPLRTEAAGTYRLIVRLLRTRNYGTVQAALDGQPLGPRTDTCDPDGVSVLDLDLGPVTFAAGQTHTLRLEVVASNPLSPGYGLSIVKLLLRPAPAPERDHDGFSLCFDRHAAVEVEQDRVLGRLVVPQACRQSVLNVLGVRRSRQLAAGERLGLATFFGAWPNHRRPDWELRQIGESAALVRDADGLRLFAAAGDDGRVQVGDLSAAAEFVVVSPRSVVAVNGSQLRLGGEQVALSGGDDLAEQPLPAPAGKAVAALLDKLWQSASAAPAGPAATEWTQLPSLQLLKQSPLTSPATACATALGGLVVGTEGGQLLRFGPGGEPTGQLQLEGAIHALAPADLQGNGPATLLVGTDAGRLYNVGPDFAALWDRTLEYHPKPWPWYTMLGPKVRAIAAGAGGVALGLGDAGLQFADRDGRPVWYRETMYGPPACVALADVLGRGAPQIIAAIGLVSGVAQGYVFGPDGAALGDFRVEGYGAGVNAMVVGDLDGGGRLSVCCGASSGKVGCYRADEQGHWQQVWAVSVGGAVRGLNIVPAPTGPGKLLLAVSEAGYVVALDVQGAVRWSRDLDGPILTATTVTLGDGKTGLTAATKDGRVVVVGTDGRILAARQLDDQPAVCAFADGLIAIGGRRSVALLRAP